MREGRPVAGAIRDAAFRRTFSAAAGNFGTETIDDPRLKLPGKLFRIIRRQKSVQQIAASREHIPLPYPWCKPPANADATIMISSFRRSPMPPAVRGWLDQYLFRNLGSLCLHLVWVAAGHAEAAFSVECKLWDIAAGAPIAEQSGAVVTSPRGDPIWPIDVAAYDGRDIPILIGHPDMHAALLRTLSDSPPPA
jgi:fructose-1,6-bisphosphatase/inositol monophosphatase family enzyme